MSFSCIISINVDYVGDDDDVDDLCLGSAHFSILGEKLVKPQNADEHRCSSDAVNIQGPNGQRTELLQGDQR